MFRKCESEILNPQKYTMAMTIALLHNVLFTSKFMTLMKSIRDEPYGIEYHQTLVDDV